MNTISKQDYDASRALYTGYALHPTTPNIEEALAMFPAREFERVLYRSLHRDPSLPAEHFESPALREAVKRAASRAWAEGGVLLDEVHRHGMLANPKVVKEALAYTTLEFGVRHDEVNGPELDVRLTEEHIPGLDLRLQLVKFLKATIAEHYRARITPALRDALAAI